MRNIIQISATDRYLTVLCDDGTVWGTLHLDKDWELHKPIPQPDTPAPVARVWTDAEVNAALDAWSRPNDPREPHVIMRAALEAADAAREA